MFTRNEPGSTDSGREEDLAQKSNTADLTLDHYNLIVVYSGPHLSLPLE